MTHIRSFKNSKPSVLMRIMMPHCVVWPLETPLHTQTGSHLAMGCVAQRSEGGPLAAASATSSDPALHRRML